MAETTFKTYHETPRWRKVIIGILYAVLCLVSISAGSMASFFNTYPLLKMEVLRSMGLSDANPYESKDDLIVLLLGCDENRTYGGAKVTDEFARTDSIHLVRFDFKHQGIGMLDIPRDTRVSVPGHHGVKITALNVYGGEDLVVEGVYQLTGIRPEKVVLVNYAFVKKLVDMVGGVEVYVEKDMKYRDRRGDLNIDLRRGWQVLDGEEAVGFMRFRHTDSTEMRSNRQEEFLIALKDEIAKDPSKVPEISNLVLEMLRTSFTLEEIDFLSHFARSIATNRIRRGRLPGTWNESNWQFLVEEAGVRDALIQAGIIPTTSASTTSR